MEHKQDLIDFVKGMAIHDAAKPFFAHGPEHSLAGYILLNALGKGREALPALVHHATNQNLELYFSHPEHKSHKLPSYLLLCSPIDQIASSVYGFMPSDPEVSGASIQNPFSRIPIFVKEFNQRMISSDREEMHNAFLKKLKKVALPEDSKDVRVKQEWKKILNQLTSLTKRWWEVAQARRDSKSPPYDVSELQEEVWQIIQNLQNSLANYPWLKTNLERGIEKFLTLASERDYSPPNDTSLINHCQLTATFAYIVYSNLSNSDDLFKEEYIQLKEGINLENQPIAQIDYINDCVKRAKENLSCYLLRISFTGYKDLLETSLTLDDFHGTANLLKRIKRAFKTEFADNLGNIALAENLVLTEDQDSFIYLIPDSIQSSDIEKYIHEAYLGASIQVIEDSHGLIDALNRNLKRITGKDCTNYKEQLVKELQALPIGFKIHHISTDTFTIGTGKDFLKFKEKFAQSLAKKIKKVQDLELPSRMPKTKLKANLKQPAQLSFAKDICEVCSINRVDEELQEYASESPELWQKIYRFFRGEPEDLCISCIARRILSYGAVQVEKLHNIVHLREDSVVKVKQPSEESFPDIPPLMLKSARLEEDGYADLQAAFVRKTHSSDSEHLLDIFPTLSYTADRNSNTALIELQPHPAIYGSYSLERLVKVFNILVDLQDRTSKINGPSNTLLALIGGRIPNADWTSEKASYIIQSRKKDADIPGLSKTIKQLEELFDYLGPIPSIAPEMAKLKKLAGTLTDFWGQDFFSIPKADLPSLQKDINDLQKSIRESGQSIEKIQASIKTLLEDEYGCDSKFLYQFYIQPYIKAGENLKKPMKNVRAHFARILHRINKVNDFFGKLPKRLEEHSQDDGKIGIRVLPIETRFPRCLLAVPTNRLTDALRVIWTSIVKDLFSSTLDPKDSDSIQKSMRVLNLFLPQVLLCSVTIFKVKQPLYMVLSISENIIQQLKNEKDDWKGAVFGFTDARGTISERGAWLATSSFIDLPKVLDLAGDLRRRPMTSIATVEQRLSRWEEPQIKLVKDAVLTKIGKRQHWNTKTIEKLQKDKFFKPTLFLLNAERR